MNDLARHKLRELIDQYGRDLCNDPRRFEALLRDHCGQCKLEIHVLIGALRERVVEELLNTQTNVPASILLPRLAQRLHDNLGLADDIANWAVRSWAWALELAIAPVANTASTPSFALSSEQNLFDLLANFTGQTSAKPMSSFISSSARGDFAAGWEAYNRGDYATALNEWHPLAEHGDANAQFNLGWMYQNGHAVIQDYEEAMQWYRRAAEQGYASAQFNLGWMYESGTGVTRDYKEALYWYRKAAEQGGAAAQFNLGVMYQYGRGEIQDDIEAAHWFRKAAEQGHAHAQVRLGLMYQNGRGVAQDNEEAIRWYRKAAEQGNAYGQTNLSMLLRQRK